MTDSDKKSKREASDVTLTYMFVGFGSMIVAYAVERALSSIDMSNRAKAMLQISGGVAAPWMASRFEVNAITQSLATGFIGPTGPNFADDKAVPRFWSDNGSKPSGKLFGPSLPKGVTMLTSKDCNREKK